MKTNMSTKTEICKLDTNTSIKNNDTESNTQLMVETDKKKKLNKKNMTKLYNDPNYFFDIDVSVNPFTSIGLFTYLRTYARRHIEDDPNSYVETWAQCLKRVVLATNEQLKCGFTHDELKDMYSLFYNLKCVVAGRFLWQLGTRTVNDSGLTSLQNCAACVIDSPVEPFTWTMNMLMMGSGVGYTVLPQNLQDIPIIKYAEIYRDDVKDADYIVPDTRQGWVKLLGKILKAHFYSGKGFTYSCMLLRSKGAPIKSFGGVASGGESLCEGMKNISDLLNKREGQRLRPIDALDIMNIIGMIVVSGNVRRSAQICLGDCKDKEYLRAKRWDLGSIPIWRCYSNNSVVCNDINDIIDDEEFWQGYQGNGEPYGLINMNLAKKCGRLNEFEYRDMDIIGVNPCAEQNLGNKETCCLAEIYLPNISSKEELFNCAKYLYRICKHSLRLPCRDSEDTENIVHKNMRMGLGITGFCMCTDEQKTWLSDCYTFLRSFDKSYSKRHKFPTSIKLTTVKPSGTLSLLAGVTAGVHPAFSQYYIRRIRVSSGSPLIDLAKKHNYHVEYIRNFDGTFDRTTMVIEFPYKLPEHAILAKNCSAIQQLENAKFLQTHWSDNSVSITVYYKKEELPEIKQWLLKNYNNSVKTVSFLLHSEHGFLQAPLEEITKDQYENLIKNTIPITSVEGVCVPYFSELETNLTDKDICAGGSCPIR
jgi:ribonucleoside-triphosphate reductase (thioredoxin)